MVKLMFKDLLEVYNRMHQPITKAEDEGFIVIPTGQTLILVKGNLSFEFCQPRKREDAEKIKFSDGFCGINTENEGHFDIAYDPDEDSFVLSNSKKAYIISVDNIIRVFNRQETIANRITYSSRYPYGKREDIRKMVMDNDGFVIVY